jgi:glycerate 2-kinase
MPRSDQQLRRDALAIWQAGVDAVRGERLARQAMHVDGNTLWVDDEPIDLAGIRKIAIVGAGKAGADMAVAVEKVLGKKLLADKQVEGWVNVPAGCERPTSCIRLHAAREQGCNEPTPAGVQGTQAILDLVESLGHDDLCIALISGGGSALLPAPVEGISLDDKLAVTRLLSSAGANIQQLNTVRKQLSRIKGGGLARACRAGRFIALIISDVTGDPLDVIASGPTVPNESSPADALAVLEKFVATADQIPAAVFDLFKSSPVEPLPPTCLVKNLIIGNNAVAVDAAGLEAERRGYSFSMRSAREPEGLAEDVGRHLADMAVRMQTTAGPDCLITGGEPVVELADASIRGSGGRNQQLVLAALERLAEQAIDSGIVLASGGTDGEDGPTDAAGALLYPGMLAAAKQQGFDLADFLSRNDAYHFFAPLDGLITTGPTQTNVCDIRVICVNRIQPQPK